MEMHVPRMVRPVATVLGLLVFAALPLPASAQQAVKYTACYVPNVGALYLIKQSGLPQSCLSTGHVEISWVDSGGEVPDGSITTAKLVDGAVATTKLASLSVTTAKLAASSVTAEKLADGAVTTTKLADLSVSTAKLAASSVTYAKIQNAGALSVLGRSENSSGVVGSIAAGSDGQVLRRSGTSLGFGQVGTAGIANAAVTNAKLAAGAVGAPQLADGAVTTAKLANHSVTAAKLAPGVARRIYWAGIRSDGFAWSHSGGISATRPSTGVYDITFPASINYCVYLATPQEGFHLVYAVYGPRYGLSDTLLRVHISNVSPTPVNAGFDVAVICH